MHEYHEITLHKINAEGMGTVLASCLEPEYYKADTQKWSRMFENLIEPYLKDTTTTVDVTARRFCRHYLNYQENAADKIRNMRDFFVKLCEYNLPPKNLPQVLSRNYELLTATIRGVLEVRNINIGELVADFGEHEALRVSALRFSDNIKEHYESNKRLEPDICGICIFISVTTEELNDCNFFSYLEKKNAQMNRVNRNILFLAASPVNIVQIRVDEEARDIRERLRMSTERDTFNFVTCEAVRARDITQAMLDYKPYVAHFSGHGTSNGDICVEDNYGNTKQIDKDALSDLFRLTSATTKCVILNACYSEQQAVKISENIDYVIGMNNKIGDGAAISFSVGFYMALGSGKSITEAYEIGCVQIGLDDRSQNNLKPILMQKTNPC